MTDDYTPLTDEQVGEIVLRDEVAFRMHPTRVTQPEIDRAALLAERAYWKRRAEAAEAKYAELQKQIDRQEDRWVNRPPSLR